MSTAQTDKYIPACAAWDTSIPNAFGYRPSLVAGVAFTVLFSLSLVLHVWQTFQHKTYWLGAAFSLGALGEVIGWGARLAANPCPYSGQLMEMQLAALIMGMWSQNQLNLFLISLAKQKRFKLTWNTVFNYSTRLHSRWHVRYPDPGGSNYWQR